MSNFDNLNFCCVAKFSKQPIIYLYFCISLSEQVLHKSTFSVNFKQMFKKFEIHTLWGVYQPLDANPKNWWTP